MNKQIDSTTPLSLTQANSQSTPDLLMEDRSTRTWPSASEGVHLASLEKIEDLGVKETASGPKHRVRLIWKIEDQQGPAGEILRAYESHTKMWSENSYLRKRVASVLGRDPGPRFNLGSLVGVRARITITQNVVGSKTYVNVVSARPVEVSNE